MTITVIGPGLIGGSLALGLRENGFAGRIIGVDNNPAHAQKALDLGLVDEVCPWWKPSGKARSSSLPRRWTA